MVDTEAVKDQLNIEAETAPNEGDFEVAEASDPAVYELGYLLVPTLDEEKVTDAIAALHKKIEDKKGGIVTEEMPKKISLAYMMTKKIAGKNERFSQAQFGWLKCELLPSEAVALHDELAADTSVLRFLLARTVREDTLQAGRQFLRSELKEKEKKAAAEANESKAPLSEVELDKSLEKLITE